MGPPAPHRPLPDVDVVSLDPRLRQRAVVVQCAGRPVAPVDGSGGGAVHGAASPGGPRGRSAPALGLAAGCDSAVGAEPPTVHGAARGAHGVCPCGRAGPVVALIWANVKSHPSSRPAELGAGAAGGVTGRGPPRLLGGARGPDPRDPACGLHVAFPLGDRPPGGCPWSRGGATPGLSGVAAPLPAACSHVVWGRPAPHPGHLSAVLQEGPHARLPDHSTRAEGSGHSW